MANLHAPPSEYPNIVTQAWHEYGSDEELIELSDISATVSTNRVFRVTLSSGKELIAKTSTYGSYVHFRQDHQLIDRWNQLMQNTRFANFLAPIVGKGDSIYTYRQDNVWVVFYRKAPFYDFLPRVLTLGQVSALGREMAELHQASTQAASGMNPTWKSLGSDIASLYDLLGSMAWREQHGFSDEAGSMLRVQCEKLLTNSEALGYHQMAKLPVLVDWNIGNFSVGLEDDGFKFFTRWDYDWFRIGPRTLDFYFCARVARAEGDQTIFTYATDCLFDPRFKLFLKAYHEVYPLQREDVLFLKEAYRFFLLNYVVRSGEHFFRPSYCGRLQRETVELHLPQLDTIDFRPLWDELQG